MLSDHHITKHAALRMKQRGLREQDLVLLLAEASQVAPDTFLLTRHDAERAIRKKRDEIQKLERLKGTKAVVVNGNIVTCCHSTDDNQRSVMRRGRSRV